MLLSSFGPGALPSPPSLPVFRIQSDTSTYQKIWVAGRRLEYACPDEAGAMGWCAVGTSFHLTCYLIYLGVRLCEWVLREGMVKVNVKVNKGEG